MYIHGHNIRLCHLAKKLSSGEKLASAEQARIIEKAIQRGLKIQEFTFYVRKIRYVMFTCAGVPSKSLPHDKLNNVSPVKIARAPGK